MLLILSNIKSKMLGCKGIRHVVSDFKEVVIDFDSVEMGKTHIYTQFFMLEILSKVDIFETIELFVVIEKNYGIFH